MSWSRLYLRFATASNDSSPSTMTESDNHSPTPSLTRVHSSESLRRVGGELRTQGGSDETLSETIGLTRPEILDESSKNELTAPASDTQFLIAPTSSINDTGPRHGQNKEWKKSTVKMLLFNTFIGTVFAVVHHILYEILSHHPTLAVSFQIGSISVGPMWALTVGNGLSWLAQLFFSLAISGALVQRFWHLVHKHHFTLHEMDRVFSITSTFYTRTALRRAAGFTMVAILSLVLGGTVSTFAPTSLTISVVPLSQPCNIMTVDLANADLDPTEFSPPLINLATHVLQTQSVMLPTSSPCGNCTYNVTYNAPALRCAEVNVSSSPFPPDSANHTVLWNETVVSNADSGLSDIFVWSRTGDQSSQAFNEPQMAFRDLQIIKCVMLNATYRAMIDHRNGTRVTAEVDIVPLDVQNAGNMTAAYASIGTAFGIVLGGHVDFNPSLASTSFVYYTNWFLCHVRFDCTTKIDLVTGLPMFMQNMSMSLLAGSVTDEGSGHSSLSPVLDGRCMKESAAYIYDRVRLLVVYGLAVLVTSYCVAKAIHAVVVGQGGTSTFSNLVYAIMSPEMIEISNGLELPEDTVIHAVKGRFVPGGIV